MALLNSFTVVKSLFNSFNATVLFNNSSEISELTDKILDESISLNLSAENIPEFLQISPKKNSVTIHVSSHMIQDVQEILDNDLNFIRSHFQYGNIYKTVDNSVTVTLYVSTGTINVQGNNVFTWIDTFVAKCELLEKEIISSQPRASTPIEFIQDFINSSIESNVEITENENHEESLNVQNDSITKLKSNYICTNSIYDGKSREDLINIIKRLESELAVKKCSEQSIQTELSAVSVECQTSQYVNTCDASTQTRPIPAPRLSKLKLTKDQCRPVLEPKSQQENSSPNPKTINNHSPEKVKKSGDKNLIIGSSILKGIRTSGLSKTNIRTFRGAHIDRITKEIMNMDLKAYKNIILQVGGNDMKWWKILERF
ncbi:Hypothetical predicted protein [Mytilus galloprovincialis]|uniref:Uncharacterized protein n=1 Tax=Mytilus galloprovincialis TaxID=29158 RepID=A0A8B6EBJ9_MYTGA|nr:Hypothetical predicted protein [Mytilus galloprovincialis]